MPAADETAIRKLDIQTCMHSKRYCEPHFAICLDNCGYEASLEVRKLYRIIPDEEAAAHGYIHIIDESGEDYAYSAGRFFVLEHPE